MSAHYGPIPTPEEVAKAFAQIDALCEKVERAAGATTIRVSTPTGPNPFYATAVEQGVVAPAPKTYAEARAEEFSCDDDTICTTVPGNDDRALCGADLTGVAWADSDPNRNCVVCELLEEGLSRGEWRP